MPKIDEQTVYLAVSNIGQFGRLWRERKQEDRGGIDRSAERRQRAVAKAEAAFKGARITKHEERISAIERERAKLE